MLELLNLGLQSDNRIFQLFQVLPILSEIHFLIFDLLLTGHRDLFNLFTFLELKVFEQNLLKTVFLFCFLQFSLELAYLHLFYCILFVLFT